MNEVQAKKKYLEYDFVKKIELQGVPTSSGYGISKKYVEDKKNRESLFSF